MEIKKKQAGMMKKNHRLGTRFAVFLLCALVCLNACGGRQPVQELDDITIQLKWVHQAQSAGMYAAREQGFYEREGLRVTFLEGGSDFNPIDTLTSGTAHFSLSSPIEVLAAADAGADIRVISTILQLSPEIFVAMENSGITTPEDFIGKKIAVLGKIEYEMQLMALLDKLEIPVDQVTLVPQTYDFMDLVSGAVDVAGINSSGGLIRLRNAGYQANIIWPSDYDLYYDSDCLVTTESIINDNADLVDRFLRATLEGWRFTLAHPEQALDAVMLYAFEQDRELQAQMLAAAVPLLTSSTTSLGMINPSTWQNTRELLIDNRVITNRVPLNTILDHDFINRIIEQEQ